MLLETLTFNTNTIRSLDFLSMSGVNSSVSLHNFQVLIHLHASTSTPSTAEEVDGGLRPFHLQLR